MYTIAALYRFTPFADPAALKPMLEKLCKHHGVRGTLLLAKEGLNGTIAGTDAGLHGVLNALTTLDGCSNLNWKLSYADTLPFHRMKVRLKKEIVTMGLPDINPLQSVGHYVAAKDWNDLISDPDTVVIDTRNDYEYAIGTFQSAIDPKTRAFREFPEWFRQFRAERLKEGRDTKVAMFCTGGIRCEKATAFVKEEGIANVFHLKGGILNYLETVPKEDSLWKGACFVFDHRVAVEHGLKQSDFTLCHACRMPLSAKDRESHLYTAGVSCHHCALARTDAQRARYAARQQQIDLAQARGEHHLGDPSIPRPDDVTE